MSIDDKSSSSRQKIFSGSTATSIRKHVSIQFISIKELFIDNSK